MTDAPRRKLIEPNGRPYVHCGKCGTDIVWPDGFSEEQKLQTAANVRSEPVGAYNFVAAHYGLNTREAKALALHITKVPGKCHRCGEAVSGPVSVCPKCRSANLDW